MKLAIFLLSVGLFAPCVSLGVNPFNREWKSDCETSLYQTYKKFQNSIKKYEHLDQKDLTEQESAEFEKTLHDFMSEYAEIVAQCQIAYEFDLLQRVHTLAENEGREDVAFLVGATFKAEAEEVWENISLND